MKSLIRISLFTMLFTVPVLLAQKPADLAPKTSPASDSLNQLAKDQTTDQKNLNNIFQQARSTLDQNQKALQEELKKSQEDLDAKLKADKHYKDEIAHITDLQKQITDAGQKAQAQFAQSIGPVNQKLQTEKAQIQGLIPVVRQENGWPDTAEFNAETQKWTQAAASPKKK